MKIFSPLFTYITQLSKRTHYQGIACIEGQLDPHNSTPQGAWTAGTDISESWRLEVESRAQLSWVVVRAPFLACRHCLPMLTGPPWRGQRKCTVLHPQDLYSPPEELVFREGDVFEKTLFSLHCADSGYPEGDKQIPPRVACDDQEFLILLFSQIPHQLLIMRDKPAHVLSYLLGNILYKNTIIFNDYYFLTLVQNLEF